MEYEPPSFGQSEWSDAFPVGGIDLVEYVSIK